MAAEIDQLIAVEIHALGINGEGVGYYQGYTLFIDGALPGSSWKRASQRSTPASAVQSSSASSALPKTE